jgi:hypothetical protein
MTSWADGSAITIEGVLVAERVRRIPAQSGRMDDG